MDKITIEVNRAQVIVTGVEELALAEKYAILALGLDSNDGLQATKTRDLNNAPLWSFVWL